MLKFNTKINTLFEAFLDEVVEGGPLNEREKLIAILTAAILVNEQKALKNAVLASKRIGFTNEELGQIQALAIAVSSQKLMNITDAPPSPANNKPKQCCT